MSVKVEVISLEEFQVQQAGFETTNFLQSAQMARVQQSREHLLDVECLRLRKENQLIGQTVVVYQKVKKFFKKAVILHGPLLHYQNQSDFRESMQALLSYFQKKKVSELSLHPYLVQTIRDESLEILVDNNGKSFTELMADLGFSQQLDPHQATVVNQVFVKSLAPFENSQSIYDAFSPSLKRDIKKFEALHVKVEEVAASDLQRFYDILVRTGERKGFYVQPKSYFEELKRAFGEQAKFMLAYLDCPAYLAYLEENIQSFEAKIKELEEGPQKKRTKGQIADAKDQLRSYYKRKEQFDQYGVTVSKLPLSAYLFMDYGNEVVSFSGGNDEDYLNFGGATLLHWHMMQYAKEQGKERFNFYGTMETEAASKGHGNFNFKRQFGGELETLVGEYSKVLSPIYALLK